MCFEHHFQQVAAVEPEDGPAVGREVAHLRELGVELFRCLDGRHVHKVVHLAHFAAAFVDGADFALEQKARAAGKRHGEAGQLPGERGGVAQAQKTGVAVLHKLALNLGQPAGVGAVARAQHANALDLGPGGQTADGEAFAGCAREARVDVQIRREGCHEESFRN
ncbi:MAG: hypothetical protein AUJ49_06250 [Desulfovibrionaceae bacterium CG1_02_65_16]|nr:MAG: hypothetical protein AUJ49_06250 [Desulfovibrionaceae bacterium CG1_02_65_16]